MVEAFTLFVVLQLVGEAIAYAAGLPVPGPVIGMALLLAVLAIWRVPSEAIDRTAEGLLSHLSLLLVPAGVGVIAQFAVIAAHGWAIGLVVVVSTLITLAATAGAFLAATRWRGTDEKARAP